MRRLPNCSSSNGIRIISRASLAGERLGSPVHPNDDVNDPLSSNDQFPSAIHVAATKATINDLKPALDHLARSLEAKATEFAAVVKAGKQALDFVSPMKFSYTSGTRS